MASGLLQFQTNAQIEAERSYTDDDEDFVLDELCAHLDRLWEAARQAKEPIQREMLDNLRQRNMEYRPEKLEQIRELGGSEVYMGLSNVKCRAGEGWIRDILLNGERAFNIKPTPDPNIPPEIRAAIQQRVRVEASEAIQQGLYQTVSELQAREEELAEQLREAAKQQALDRSKGMEDKIDDVLVEGGWYEALETMVSNVITQHTGFMKGPVYNRKKKLRWMEGPSGEPRPYVEDELTPMFYAPNPFDIYPSPDATSPDKEHYFERIQFSRFHLHRMIGVPGYKEEAIRAVLQDYDSGFDLNLSHDDERDRLEGRLYDERTLDGKIDALEFWGEIRGRLLQDWGMDEEQVPDPDADYPVTLIKIRRHVVRCIINPDPLDRRPLVSASFEKVSGAFWGRGLCQLLADLQDICNASARNLVNNMGIASGPIGEVDYERLAEGEDPNDLRPWKMIQTRRSEYGDKGHAVQFFNVDSHAEELMRVYEFYAVLADEYSGIPKYSYGVSTAGVNTATESTQLQNAAARGIKRVVGNIDRATEGTVQRTFTIVMLYHPDHSIKLDAQIKATGSKALIQKEQQAIRRMELLQATANPLDAQIIGALGRAHQLRETFRANEMDADKIVPSEDELRRQIMQAALQGPPGAPPGEKPVGVDGAGNRAGGADAQAV